MCRCQNCCSLIKPPAEPYLLPHAAVNSTRLLLHPSGLLPIAPQQRASGILCRAHYLQWMQHRSGGGLSAHIKRGKHDYSVLTSMCTCHAWQVSLMHSLTWVGLAQIMGCHEQQKTDWNKVTGLTLTWMGLDILYASPGKTLQQQWHTLCLVKLYMQTTALRYLRVTA